MIIQMKYLWWKSGEVYKSIRRRSDQVNISFQEHYYNYKKYRYLIKKPASYSKTIVDG